MNARSLSIGIAAVLTFSSSLQAFADSDYFYYVIPPQSSIVLNEQERENSSETEGKMLFQQASEEEISVAKGTVGVRLISKKFEIDLREEARLGITDIPNLESGSIHVQTKPTSTEEGSMMIGNLLLRFQSADFIAFVSGDQTETIIKVLQGEVQVEQSSTDQEATIKALQATSTDSSGRLLIPYPFEAPTEGLWWEDELYEVTYPFLAVADAGEDQRVVGNIAVVLDGSKSSYKTGDIFEWTLEKGPKDSSGQDITQVTFDSTNIVKPLFTPIVDGEYLFSLQITDQLGEKSNIDMVAVFVGKSYLQPIAIFPDVPADHPNNLAITYLYKKNVMKGSEDPATGKILFRPADTINRVEILKTIFENKRQKIPTTEELSSLSEEIFIDVKPEHWFAPYVYLAKKMEIVHGNNGLYRPADKVTLVEALKILVQANQISLESYKRPGEKPYPDAEADAWYTPSLFFVKKYNLLDPNAEGKISPAQPLSRAQFAEIIYRMESVNLLEERGFLTGTLKDSVSKQPVADAEIYIYKVLEDASEAQGFVKKGDLVLKVSTQQDGSFSASLPINAKYYVEALSGDTVSTNRVVTELKEDQSAKIDLEITIGDQ